MNSATQKQQHTSINLSIFRLLRLLFIQWKLSRHDKWTRNRLLDYQAKKLKALRKHAYKNSPFYKRFHAGLFSKSLQELPVLTKEELMKNWNEVVTDPALKIDDLRKFVETLKKPLLFNGEYIVSTTSGTTGLKGAFAFNRKEWLHGLASHGRATAWAGAKIGLFNRVRLAVVSSIQPWCKSLLVGASVDTTILPTLRLDSTEPLDSIAKQLNNFQPELLVAYAGTAKVLAKQQLSGKLQISPKMVFASSEILQLQTRKIIQDAWSKEPFNAYASTETALIAADCTHHNMHICEDLVIIEVVNKDNQLVPQGAYGEKLLITTLFSRTIPLIRYEISDSVMLGNSSVLCTCGKPFLLLAGIQGRIEDTIYLNASGNKEAAIKPDTFHDVLEPAPISGWQVTQESKTSIRVSIIDPQPEYKEQVLIENLRRRLYEQGALNPEIRIEIVEKLKQSTSGKTPLVKALKK
jgi:putative adenylate-forming enzyme